MTKYNASNERIKRRYFAFLKEAKRHSEDTVDAAAKALSRFEADNQYRDFKAFHFEQAIAFKRRIAEQTSQVTGQKLSKATMYSTLANLKRFFQWLAEQPGYKSRLQYSNAEYFNLSDKDIRVATARRDRPVPTLAQIKHTLATMPSATEIEKRDRALVAFTLLTGARDSAIASIKLKHLDLANNCIFQDAREVRTKFSKTFVSDFFPVGEDIRQIVVRWVSFLLEERLWGNNDPLFPATKVTAGENFLFERNGLDRKHWSNTTPIRKIFQKAFDRAGLPYFNPHSFRKTLAQLGETTCRSPEEFKAWSQNLGHEEVLTTFRSYGEVAPQRQRDIMRGLSSGIADPCSPKASDVADAVFQRLRDAGLVVQDPSLGRA